MPAALKLKGEKFGMLTVLSHRGTDRNGQMKWACKCECGNRHVTISTRLKRGLVKSCGCIKPEVARKNLRRAKLCKA